LPSRFSLLFAHDFFRKPLHTFPDHALIFGNLSFCTPSNACAFNNAARLCPGVQEYFAMFIRLSAAIAAVSLLSGAVFAQGAKPTDPQIAHIAYTAGLIDIAAAKQALAKASNKDVKTFAQDMVRDHEAVNKQALDLVKKLNVTPEDNDTSKTLSKNAADKLAELSKLNGAAFDKAYIANEVAYHKSVDSVLETTLIPSANNAELKSLLQTGLKIFQGHEQHAEHVAAELK
jgi:putative membrane protein